MIEQIEWVSVKDRLPDATVQHAMTLASYPVLTRLSDGEMEFNEYFMTFQDSELGQRVSEKGWIDEDKEYPVTHWATIKGPKI